MPVHFAAARSTANSPIARALARKAITRAANDNGAGGESRFENSFDQVMRAALSHFAEHGLNAAYEAQRQAEQAHSAGDKQSYQWWLGVCRTLDRGLATRLDRRINTGAALIY